jgi:hypothetical protein
VREIRRFDWLHLVETGMSTRDIARQYKCGLRSIELALVVARAEALAFAEAARLLRPPALWPWFPIDGLFPHSKCNHDQVPIPKGSRLYCSLCSRSGMDDHPALARFPLTDPRPDPPLPEKAQPLTRREKRARLRDRRRARVTVSS